MFFSFLFAIFPRRTQNMSGIVMNVYRWGSINDALLSVFGAKVPLRFVREGKRGVEILEALGTFGPRNVDDVCGVTSRLLEKTEKVSYLQLFILRPFLGERKIFAILQRRTQR